MDNISLVQVVNTQAYVNEDLPNKILNKRLALLLSNVVTQVTVVAKLHDHIDLLIVDE